MIASYLGWKPLDRCFKYFLNLKISVWSYNVITNKSTRSLSIIFVDKKYTMLWFCLTIFHMYISHIPDEQLAVLKTRIRNTCHKYNRINVPCRYREIIRNLSNNEKIKVLKKDKDRQVVIMDSSQYMNKCLNMLNNDNFLKLTDDPKN